MISICLLHFTVLFDTEMNSVIVSYDDSVKEKKKKNDQG